jgi:malate/lactate dehydrogenase
VVDTLPHLVQQVLPKPPAPLEQSLELDRLRIAHQRRHNLKATARRAHVIVIGHISPSSVAFMPRHRRGAALLNDKPPATREANGSGAGKRFLGFWVAGMTATT